MNEQDYGQLTLFPADSPASRSVWLESKKVKGTTVTFGRKCSELSENLRRVGYLVRTFLESSELPPGTWSRTWSVKDMTSRCLIMKLRLSERRTDGNESRLLPTVTATVADHGGPNQRDSSGRPGLQMAAMLWPTPDTQNYRDGNTMRKEAHGRHGVSLHHAVAQWKSNIENEDGQPKLWKTPVAADGANREFYHNSRGEPNLSGMVKIWPTPTARDYKDGTAQSCQNVPVNGLLGRAVHIWPTPRVGGSKGNSPQGVKHHDLAAWAALYPTPTTGAGLCGGTGNFKQLQALMEQGVITDEERRNMSQGNGGQLNPDWVCAMMGFPPGWLNVDEPGQTEAGNTESRE